MTTERHRPIVVWGCNLTRIRVLCISTSKTKATVYCTCTVCMYMYVHTLHTYIHTEHLSPTFETAITNITNLVRTASSNDPCMIYTLKTVHVHNMIGLILCIRTLYIQYILLEQYACDPGFSLFYRIDRAGPNEPIHLREKSYASRDSQGINNLLHPKMFFWKIYKATLA